MIKYTNNKYEDVPLLISYPENLERVKRKESRRNIFITILVFSFIALVVTLAIVFKPGSEPSEPAIDDYFNNNNSSGDSNLRNFTESDSDPADLLIDNDKDNTTQDENGVTEAVKETVQNENTTNSQLLRMPFSMFADSRRTKSKSLLKNNVGAIPVPVRVDEKAKAETTIPPHDTIEEHNKLLQLEIDQNGRSPVVKVSQGKLQGLVTKSRQGRDYFSFYSIPYAKPPVGQRRFEPPEPAEKWEDEVYDAGLIRAQCIPVKKPDKEFKGSEDCLHLHLMTPKLPTVVGVGADKKTGGKTDLKLPVMFYILGGAFNSGRASQYSGKYFMDEEVILVFVDYRFGAFGHLNTGDTVLRGNLSFKDQVLALKWVQENIHIFGGDPQRVIIFGNSSGGMSVHAHLLSNMSKGLFYGAITESGVMIGPNVPSVSMTDPGSMAQKLGKELDCPLESSEVLAKCLKEAHPFKIASVNLPEISWGLTREAIPADGDTSHTFLSDTPMNIMRSGQFNQVPWIAGVNSAEKFGDANELVQDPEHVALLNQNWTELVMDDILHLEDDNQDISNKIKKSYFNDTDYIDESYRNELGDLLSDRVWVHPTKVAGVMHSKFSPVYFYYFSKEPLISIHDKKKFHFQPPYGVGHGDEIQFFFEFYRYSEITVDSPDYEFSKDFIKIWVSFATNGFPDGTIAHGSEKGAQWNVIQEKQNGMKWFEINDNVRQSTEPFTRRMEFWDSLGITLLYES